MTRVRRLAMGVDEEYLLLDARSRDLADRGPALVAATRPELGAQVRTRRWPAQLGVRTEPMVDSADLRAELDWLRTTVAAAARDAGCRCVAAGTPLLGGVPAARSAGPPASVPPQGAVPPRPGEAPPHGGPRDRADGPVCCCGIHIGPLDAEQAAELAAHLRPWLPVFVTLAANSPFAYGRDTGCASWRSARFGRRPAAARSNRAGPGGPDRPDPARAPHVRAPERRDGRSPCLRPSGRRPTLEVLVPDANADLDTVVLLAVLLRGLATALLPAVADRRPAPVVPEAWLRQSYAHASRHGLRGPGLDPLSGTEAAPRLLLERMVELAAPGIAAAGDVELVEGLLRRVRRLGGGAARQRAVHERWGGLEAVVDALALATSGADPGLLTPVG
ncbi:carboxylate-amine ligase [Streptomyces antimicrobicus]|uniref:Glutamate--cysteine ligase n=1 Tax=Streptomyces antimicrobicus TaxID=2883108 RepID=A0ABS8B3K5_9ACTN|nr:glutamate-cysteine ligase family protein [Streptomyces antimicrobicus]MCB5179190.1 hypothetical protein [Streptomyces antimicrobicus]